MLTYANVKVPLGVRNETGTRGRSCYSNENENFQENMYRFFSLTSILVPCWLRTRKI